MKKTTGITKILFRNKENVQGSILKQEVLPDQSVHEKGLFLVGPTIHTEIIVIVTHRNFRVQPRYLEDVVVVVTSKPAIQMELQL